MPTRKKATTKKRFQIQGMHCVGCAMAVDEALERLPGVTSATTHYARQVAEVEYDPAQVTEARVAAAAQAAGYTAVALG
jgi:copper chaperone CopZ